MTPGHERHGRRAAATSSTRSARSSAAPARRGGSLSIVGDPGIRKTSLLRGSPRADRRPAGGRRRLRGRVEHAVRRVQRLLLPSRHISPGCPCATNRPCTSPPGPLQARLRSLSSSASACSACSGAPGSRGRSSRSSTTLICSTPSRCRPWPSSRAAWRRSRQPCSSPAGTSRSTRPRWRASRPLRLGGLPSAAAMRLLTGSLSEPLYLAVAMQIVTATGGNPLALVDLAGELSVAQLTESGLGDEPIPVGRHLESFYLRQVHLLGEDVRLWLLVAGGRLDRRRRPDRRRGRPARAAPRGRRRRRVGRAGRASDTPCGSGIRWCARRRTTQHPVRTGAGSTGRSRRWRPRRA